MDAAQIGLLVRKYRKLSGLTQKELANLGEVGKTAIFDLEKGKEGVQLKTVLKILSALNITLTLIPPFNSDEE